MPVALSARSSAAYRVLQALAAKTDEVVLKQAHDLHEVHEEAWMAEGRAMVRYGPDAPETQQVKAIKAMMYAATLDFAEEHPDEWTIATWGAIDRDPRRR